MRLPIALTVAALAIPLTSAALLPGADTDPSDPLAAAAAQPREGRTLKGTIGGWFVEEDGSVLVRLVLDGNKGERWLRTAANQSSTTQFELLALHTVLALGDESRQKRKDCVVRGESTSERDGSSEERAMRLTGIGRH